MKTLFCVLGTFVLISGFVHAGQLCRSGSFVIERDPESGGTVINELAPSTPFAPLADTIELLSNGGFETGVLEPWQTYAWQVTGIDSHAGQYCAADVGNNWIRQDFAPVLTDSIVSITFWSRQPDNQIQAFDFVYNDNTYFEDIVWPTSTWQMFNVTSYVPSGRYMVALRLWGYVGGGPAIDSTYTDDVSIMVVTQGTKVEERVAAARPLAFNVSPNPVRGNALIEYCVLSGEKRVLSIYDIKGAVMERVNLEGGKYVWSTKGLETGVYLVRLDAGDGQSSVEKVVVLK